MNRGGRAERAHPVLMSGGERLELGALLAREGSEAGEVVWRRAGQSRERRAA